MHVGHGSSLKKCGSSIRTAYTELRVLPVGSCNHLWVLLYAALRRTPNHYISILESELDSQIVERKV